MQKGRPKGGPFLLQPPGVFRLGVFHNEIQDEVNHYAGSEKNQGADGENYSNNLGVYIEVIT
jgi:hypothetical protein